MQNSQERPTRGRYSRIACCIIWEIICLLVIAAAIAMTIGLATQGSKYSIAAAAVLVLLAIMFVVFPAIACVVVCGCRAGKYECAAVRTAVAWSLVVVFRVAPFFLVTAAVLSIIEITMGKGQDDASVLGLAVAAFFLNVVAVAASIFLCTTSCIYVCRRIPARATKEGEQEEERLVPKEKEPKSSEMEKE